MARFLVKASEFKNVCKAVNDRKLAELKKEIIEILKKQDENEVKKAIDYFESQELHYTHLEKSFNGKWVEKAGYGVGTVRIWKGKKYKKIAPGKWARVFDKEGRGTNIAIGKLIAKVQKIDNVEDLMAFVMANKQRFVDENGMDLPVLDKLRAAVDARNGNVGSKDKEYKLGDQLKLKNGKTVEYAGKVKDGKIRYTDRNGSTPITGTTDESEVESVDNSKLSPKEQTENFVIDTLNNKKDSKQTEKKSPEKLLKEMGFERMEKVSFNGEKWEVAGVSLDYNGNVNGISLTPDRQAGNLHSSNVTVFDIDKIQKNKPAEKKEELSWKDKVLMATDEGAKKELGRGKMYKKHITDIQRIANSNINDIPEKLKTLNDFIEYQDSLSNPDYKQAGKDYARLKNHELAREIWKKVEDGEAEWDDNGYLKLDEHGLLAKPEKQKESDFDIDSIKGQTGAVAMLKDQMETWPKEKLTEYYNDKLEKIKNNKVPSVAMQNVKNQFVAAKELLNEKYKNDESEAEKHQNRSEAMKGNKNAYKGGSKEELQNELMSLSKQKSEILDEIKKTNGDLAKINQDKYNDEARGNPTEDYDKQIEELKKKMDNLQDEHADIEKRGNDIVKELDKLEKEENKVIVNNPEALKGIDFVNKNKMHTLANFLANHDNVNMATAVVRLQNAYEKLGEENFLAHFPKDVVERYRKEAGKEEPKKKSFTPISKDKMKSMSDEELKDYEAKLEKDLLATSRTDPDYVEKYNHWREVHGENNDRFHQAIEDEARTEKQAEADAKAQKENEIKERYNGYFDGKKGLDKARDLKLLEKKYNFEGKGVMTSKDFVEQAIDNGEEIREREVNKLDYPSRTRWNRMNNYEQEQYEKRIKAAGKKMLYSIGGYEFPKGVVDYAKFYKEKGKSKLGNEKPSKSETAIKNKAASLAGAFGYSKTYATKMGSPFNLELAEQTVDEELDWDDGSKKALKEELRRIYSEKKVQKSIFDDFVMDMLVDEDEEDFEVRKIDESLWNDYSAEQPELFNSTELMVREAFNRCRVL